MLSGRLGLKKSTGNSPSTTYTNRFLKEKYVDSGLKNVNTLNVPVFDDLHYAADKIGIQRH